jgi:hypothetical protein
MHLPKAGGWHNRGVQVLPMRPGNFALGSPQSRAAARAMLVARKASKEDELSFEAVSILDGSRLNCAGLADRMRAARMRDDVGGLPASLPTSDSEHENNAGRRADCLLERMRRAEERLRRAQDPETMP